MEGRKIMAVTTLRQAQNALEKHRKLKAEIEDLLKKNGIAKKMKQAEDLKKEATDWAIENDADQIELDGAHATLVRQHYGGRWIATDDDIDEGDPANVQSLYAIIEENFKSKISEKGSAARKTWHRITRRVVDPKLIDDAVALGVFKPNEIALAYVEKEKAPYLRVFDDE
jgi:hypothetical protein